MKLSDITDTHLLEAAAYCNSYAELFAYLGFPSRGGGGAYSQMKRRLSALGIKRLPWRGKTTDVVDASIRPPSVLSCPKPTPLLGKAKKGSQWRISDPRGSAPVSDVEAKTVFISKLEADISKLEEEIETKKIALAVLKTL